MVFHESLSEVGCPKFPMFPLLTTITDFFLKKLHAISEQAASNTLTL